MSRKVAVISCKVWHYLYLAVDSMGATLDCMLSATRDADAEERFFRQVLQASPTRTPRVITVDKNTAYPPAFESLQPEKTLPESSQLRPCKYLNDVVEIVFTPLTKPHVLTPWSVRESCPRIWTYNGSCANGIKIIKIFCIKNI
jgi:transposase-like protein